MLILPVGLAAALAASTPAPEAPAPSAPDATPITLSQDEEAADEAADAEPAWTGSATAGLSTTSGNTEIDRASATADAVLESSEDRWTLGFSWAYQGDNGGISQRRTQGTAQYDLFFEDSLFAYGNASLLSDFTANLDLRTQIGVGMGKDIYKTDAWYVNGEVGVSSVMQDFRDDTSEDFIAGRLAYNANHTPEGIFSLEHSGELLPSLSGSDGVAKFDTRLKASLTENFFGQFQWVVDYNRQPAAGRKKTDQLFLLTIGWKF